MDLDIRHAVDAASKIAGVIALFVAIFGAWYEVRKNRQERNLQLENDAHQRAKELEEARLNTKATQARFWLELRKMFSEHNKIHLNLRPGGEWYKSYSKPPGQQLPSTIQLPEVEAYMGLFEHCKLMLDNGMIDWNTFKRIYAYRIINILSNPVIVREKLIKQFQGWEDFIQLAKELTGKQAIIKRGREWLNSEEGEIWLNTKKGQDWLTTEDGGIWSTISGENLR